MEGKRIIIALLLKILFAHITALSKSIDRYLAVRSFPKLKKCILAMQNPLKKYGEL